MENVKIDDDHRRDGGVEVDDDDPQDEEMKIEKFFSLIKSYREARDRLMVMRNKQISCHDDDHEILEKKIKKKRMKINAVKEQSGSAWVPSFECSDFLTTTNSIRGQVVPLREAPLMTLPNTFNIIKQLETSDHHDDQTPHNKASKQDNNDIGLDLNLNLTL